MKKFISILLCSVMLSLYFTVFSIPTMAVDYMEAYSLEQLSNQLKNGIRDLPRCDHDTVKVIGNGEIWYVTEPIKINKSCNVVFQDVQLAVGDDGDYNYYDDCLIEVNANDVNLDFYNCTIDTDQHDLLGDGELVCEQYGSILYVDGNGCQIDCHDSTFCGKTSAKYGGAIYIDNRDDCVIKNAKFTDCESSKQGGAIYVYGENCVIENCKFSGCSAPNGGSNVFSYYEGETLVSACTDTDGNDIDKSTCVGCTVESVKNYLRRVDPARILYPAYPEDGYYIIHSAVNPNFCLDIAGGSNAKNEGANVRLLPTGASNAKTFEIKREGNLYKITATHSGMVLDVYNGLTEIAVEGANIQQWTNNGGTNQRWIFEDDAPGENCYYIHAKLAGNTGWMDAAGCVNGAMPQADGSTNVYSWSYTGAENQMWILEKVDYTPSGFTLSEGNTWIIAGIAIIAIGTIVVIAKKKKKPALAEDEITVAENTEKTEE